MEVAFIYHLHKLSVIMVYGRRKSEADKSETLFCPRMSMPILQTVTDSRYDLPLTLHPIYHC